jgi:RNA polymerase sigma-70 factor (ECF subfamily)
MESAWKESANAAMGRYAGGDDAAFAELYGLMAPRLRSFLRLRTADAARAEDLLQQTFLQMHCARGHFVPRGDMTAWAFVIARRVLIDDYRKKGPVLAPGDWVDHESAAPGALPDRILGQRRLTRRVREEVARLPQPQREAFDLVQVEGMSMADAAAALGTTVATVKLRAFRSYKALRAQLRDDVLAELRSSP